MQDFDSVYQINTKELCFRSGDDITRWSGVYNFLAPNKTIIDRSCFIKMPFKFKVYDRFLLPKMDKNFTKTFDEICLDRAEKILEKQKQTSKPIYFFYSGGIDSTAALISFIKIRPIKELIDNLVIVMTSDGIIEYPEFYYSTIRSNFKIINADSMFDFFDGNRLLVTGGLGDKIFGTDNIGRIYRLGLFNLIQEKFNRFFITNFWTMLGLNQNSADVWYDLLEQNIKFNDANVVSNFDFLWWFNFLLEWQSEYFQFTIRSKNQLAASFYDENVYAFYDSYEFQQWSMLNRDLKIKDHWSSYKFIAKDFIYSYTKDQKYRDEKIKGLSLNRLFHAKSMPLGIDKNFNYFYSIDKEKLYYDGNSFR